MDDDGWLYHGLSVEDAGVEASTNIFGYVLQGSGGPTDAALEAALAGVIDRWRPLAGRVVRLDDGDKDSSAKKWALRYPDRPLPSSSGPGRPYTFRATSRLSAVLDPPLTSLSTSSTALLHRPRLDLFHSTDLSIPPSLEGLASSSHPLISMQVTRLADEITCIGFSLPHGVFDVLGMGAFLHAFEAELGGEAWDPPPFSEQNPLDAAMLELQRNTSGATDASADDAMRDFPPSTAATVAQSLSSFESELSDHRAERRTLWIGKEVLDRLVASTKEEVRHETSGKEFCSTGDIIIGWMLKAMYSLESSSSELLACSSVMTTRSMLLPSLPAYWNNASALFPSLPLLPISALPSIPVSSLARHHRQRLDSYRGPSHIANILHWRAQHPEGAVMGRPDERSTCIFTNQSVARLPSVRFSAGDAGRVKGFWQWDLPATPDNAVAISVVQEGALLTAVLRKSRWEAVAEELSRLEKGIF